MEIILLERIGRLGRIGDIVKVKNGFARNFLLPTKKAARATDENKKEFKNRQVEFEQQDLNRKTEAEKIADSLSGKKFTIIRSASETGQLYGSVSSRDIADLLSGEGFAILRGQIGLNNPVKSTGIMNIEILLHPEVTIEVSLNVARNTEEAEKQEKENQALKNPENEQKLSADNSSSPKKQTPKKSSKEINNPV